MCTCMGDCGCVHAYNCGWVVLHFFEEWYGIRKNTSVSHLETWVGYDLYFHPHCACSNSFRTNEYHQVKFEVSQKVNNCVCLKTLSTLLQCNKLTSSDPGIAI